MDTTSFIGEHSGEQVSVSGGRSRSASREVHSEGEHIVFPRNYESSIFLSDEALPSERARSNIERHQLREKGSSFASHRETQSAEFSYTTFAHVRPNSTG